MADTIVNTPDRSSGDSAAGWAVAVIVILAVIVAGVFYYRRAPAPANPAASVQVNIPNTGGTGSSGGTTGGTSGGSTGGTSGTGY